jgi:Tfp pilus assembly protein PilF
MRLGEPVLAQKSFLLAEKAAPLDADIAHNHAVFLCEQGHYKNSFERFESAMNRPLYSEKAKTMWVWGVCSHKSGDIQSAQQLWTQSLTIKATAETALALALSLKQHNQDARAAEVLKNFNVLEAASAETLLLGVQWARQSSDSETSKRYTSILRQRFPTSAQWGALQREAFDD